MASKRHPRQERAHELLNDVGLPLDAMMRFPSQLSGGQKLTAQEHRPGFVWDAETGGGRRDRVPGLDVSLAQVLNLLIELGRRHGRCAVLVSHDLLVVRFLCSRVVVMQHGNVVEQGNTEEGLRQYLSIPTPGTPRPRGPTETPVEIPLWPPEIAVA